MQTKRCFLCGHKMAENGLCTNSECIRSTPVPGTAVAETLSAEKEAENTETQGKQRLFAVINTWIYKQQISNAGNVVCKHVSENTRKKNNNRLATHEAAK